MSGSGMDAARPVRQRWLAWTLVGGGVAVALLITVALVVDGMARKDLRMKTGLSDEVSVRAVGLDVFTRRPRIIYQVRIPAQAMPPSASGVGEDQFYELVWHLRPWREVGSATPEMAP